MAAGNAVFNEVLQITIDTAQFAAEMKKVEAIYAQSLQNMPDLAAMGPMAAASAFATAATEISQAAQMIETNVIAMSGNVTTGLAGVQAAVVDLGLTAQMVGEEVIEGMGAAGAGIGGVGAQMGGLLLIIEAFKLLKDVVVAPFIALKEGIKYLESTQELSSQIQATLLQTEKFSADPAKNLAAARKEADRLATSVQDVSAKLNIVAPQIKAAFDRFLLTGGGQDVKNNDEALNTVALISAGLQTQVPKEQAARISASEIAKLVQGTLTAAERLPAAFGVSAEKLNEVSVAARSTHDLFERLSALAPGLTERIAESGDRMQSLSNYAELLKQRLEAAFTGDFSSGIVKLLKQLIEYLKEAQAWADRNKEAINAFISVLSEGISSVVSSLAQLAKGDLSASPLMDGLKTFATMANAAAFSFGSLLTAYREMLALEKLHLGADKAEFIDKDPAMQALKEQENSLYDRSNSSGGPRDKGITEALKENAKKQDALGKKLSQDYEASATQELGNAQRDRDAYFAAYSNFQSNIDNYNPKDHPTKSAGKESPAPFTNIVQPDNGKNNLGSKEFKDEVDLIDGVTKNFVESQKEQFDKRAINQRTASNNAIKALDEEDKEYKLLADRRRAQIAGDANATPVQKDAANEVINRAERDHENKNAALKKAQREAAAKAEIEAKVELTNALLKIEEDDAKAEVALIKKRVAEGLETRRQGNTAEIAAERVRHLAANDTIAQLPNVGEHDQAERQSKQLAEDALNQRNLNALRAQGTEAIKADSAALDANNAAQMKIRESTLEANLEAAKSIGNKRGEIAATRELIALKLQQADLELVLARAKKGDDSHDATTDSKTLQDDQTTIDRLQAQVTQLEKQQGRAGYSNDAVGQAEYRSDNGGGGGDIKGFGVDLDNLKQNLDLANGPMEKFAIGVGAAATLLTNLGDAVTSFLGQLHKGNALGAVGGALSNGGVEDALGSAIGKVSESMGDLVPVIGPMIGGMFTAISGLFQTSIQNMVNDINQQIQNINQQAQLKQIGIAQQIQELKEEEQAAISSLGGKKKASSQLKGILQQLNDEIAQLQVQAAQTIQTFNDMVAAASISNTAGSMVASEWLNTWTQINQQVEAYVQAGGSLATAATYLNQQLQQQQMQLTDQLNQGNQQAIQDALQLNQLQQQKVQLMQKEAQTEFGLLNADSLERNTASAVATGQALTQQREQYAQQLLDLNNQITLEQQKVTAESTIFNLAQSTAALQAQSNALTLASLEEQLSKFQEMQAILAATNGLTFTPGSINPGAGLNGTQAPIPGLPTVAGPTIGTINVTINGDATTTNVESLGAAIATNIRSGRTTFSIAGG